MSSDTYGAHFQELEAEVTKLPLLVSNIIMIMMIIITFSFSIVFRLHREVCYID